MSHKVIKEPFFQTTCIFHADHHIGQLRFKNPRRGKIIGRPNFAKVRGHGILALWAIHTEARPIGLTNGKDEITHPSHRKIGQDFFTRSEGIEL